jgi:NAD(P)-dependent dehydrogenase (short-subunit alcohol dehydrogenase family)
MKDLFSLAGRTALVTGGSRGVGRMIATGLLHQGATVCISARKAAACEAAAQELSHIGPCIALPGDVSTVEGARALAREFESRCGPLHILVNNAGAAWGEAFDTFPESGWDKVVDLNLKAPFFVTQAFHDQLRRAATPARPAKVINIASIDGLSVNPWETYSYGASKAGLIHLTRRLALRLIQDHIVVSGIAPGHFPSDMNKEARDHGEELARQVPAGRLGTPQDIAAAAIYLASRAGDYVVGETVVVDGGANFGRGSQGA